MVVSVIKIVGLKWYVCFATSISFAYLSLMLLTIFKLYHQFLQVHWIYISSHKVFFL